MEEKIHQHNTEILLNKSYWEKKPGLRKSYYHLYQKIESQISDKSPGLTLEIGSGIGRIKDIIPYCTTSDLFENQWLERIENAYKLNYSDQSLSNILLFDVWHHLEFPMAFLDEANRVLKPGGKVILMEPDMSLIGRFIYGNFHHEPLGFQYHFNLSTKANQNTYFAAQSSAWRFFIKKEMPIDSNHWKTPFVKRIVSFAYLVSGGFSGPSFYPSFLYPLIKFGDAVLSIFPRLFSARILIVLEKK